MLGSCNADRRQAIKELHSSTPEVRAKAALRLADMEGAKSIGRIRPLLYDSVPGVRLSTVSALIATGSSKAVTPLLVALKDAEPQVRLAAIRGLALLGDHRAIAPLLIRLDDRSPAVRRTARAALLRLGLPVERQIARQADTLRTRYRAMLRSSHFASVLAEAAKMLGRSEEPKAVGDLLPLLHGQPAEVVIAVAAALTRIGGKQALSALVRVLRASPSASVRRALQADLVAAFETTPPGPWAYRLLDRPGPERRILLVAMDRWPIKAAPDCRFLCPERSDDASPQALLAAVRLSRKHGCVCDTKFLNPELRTWVDAVTGRVPSRAMLDRLSHWYDTHLPGPGMGPNLRRFDPSVLTPLRKHLARLVSEYVEQSRPWLTEAQWKKLDQDPKAQPLGSKTAAPRDPKANRLRRLLARFPARSWKHVVLLPPATPNATVGRALDLLGYLPGTSDLLAEFSMKLPADLAVVALAAIGHKPRPGAPSPTVIHAVRRALAGGPQRRMSAVAALAAVGKPALVMLSEIVRRDPDESVRDTAALALAHIGTPEAAATIRRALAKWASPSLVEAAARSKDTGSTQMLLTWLNRDPTNRAVRIALVRALGTLGTNQIPGLVATIRSQLEYPDPDVRVAAAQSLANLAAREAKGDLRACRRDFDGAVRRACKQALAHLARKDRGGMPKKPKAF
ncbi:MAG: HEAT repeat domain-containing protein [Deltaproteobacteria bacterium]|nr:HEAT repeat domain-containing protein [Deltaproteobacteria bacterium]